MNERLWAAFCQLHKHDGPRIVIRRAVPVVAGDIGAIVELYTGQSTMHLQATGDTLPHAWSNCEKKLSELVQRAIEVANEEARVKTAELAKAAKVLA